MALPNSPKSPDSALASLLATVIAFALLVAGLVLLDVWRLRENTVQNAAELQARQLGEGLETYVRLLGRQAEVAAAAAVDAVASGDPARIESAKAAMTPQFAYIDSLQIVMLGNLGIAAPAFAPESLRNNIEIDLAGRAFKNTADGAESYDFDGRRILVVAAPIKLPAGNGGVVLVRADLGRVFRELLLPRKPQGEYSLWRAAGAKAAEPIGRAGDAGGAGSEIHRVGTHVRGIEAGFASARTATTNVIAGLFPLLLAIASAGLGMTGIVMLIWRRMRATLVRDAVSLSELALHQRVTTAAAPALHNRELTLLAEDILRLRRESVESSSRRPSDAASRRPLAKTVEPEAEEAEVAPPAELAVPAEIFRAYDIRGRAEQFAPELVHLIGMAIGSEALERGQRAIVLGADGRLSSPRLREQMLRGLLATGIDVIDVGVVATPMLYFACHRLETHTGVMVTGSHNPPDHNGFKVMIGGDALCGEGIEALYRRILDKRLLTGQGNFRVTEIDREYIDAVADDVLVDAPLDAPLKVVIDCANGAAAVVAEDLFRQLGCEVFPLFCEIDGKFPNHAPDPAVPGNLRALIGEVAKRKADIGIAFDGDGDRIGVVSARGRIVPADRLLMLLAGELLSRHPGADIVFDVKCSRDLASVITQHGGRPVMWRSGHSWIKQKMKEDGALLGGEFTGHICFRDRWFGFDDALYCGARLLEIITTEGRTLDDMLAALPQSVGTPEIPIPIDEGRKFEAMEVLEVALQFEGARMVRIDGVRAEFADGWGLVRASNTSAALVCRFEAADEDALGRIRAQFAAELRRLLPDIAIEL